MLSLAKLIHWAAIVNQFPIVDMFRGKGEAKVVLDKIHGFSNEMRKLAHHISDLIYEQITGTRGIFSTKIAYVVMAIAHVIFRSLRSDESNPRPFLIS